jgi:tRNA(fMet)-specific endonuclease VapC
LRLLEETGWEEIAVSTVTVAELFYGAYKSQRVEENVDRIKAFIGLVEILDFDFPFSVAFGQLKAYLMQTGQILLDADLMIAATALHTGRVLVSNNTRHFGRIPGLTLENWHAP